MAAAQHLPETILRTRGRWSANLEGTKIPGVSVLITLGLILVPEGTSATVLWSPFTDDDAPWFWWDTCVLTYNEYVTDVIASTEVASGRFEIDSKAMRKVRNREVQLVVENTTLGSASVVDVNCGVRILAGA